VAAAAAGKPDAPAAAEVDNPGASNEELSDPTEAAA
jgi:hypothetical protein